MDLRAHLRPALVLLALLSALTGLAYPLAVTGAARVLFPAEAAGSLVTADGEAVGSRLIGQPFDDPALFWGRPSAIATPYDARTSSGSNQGPRHPALAEAVAGRIAALRAADPDNRAPVPADLVTASGSGLDPHITPAAARYQAPRIARLRGLTAAEVTALIDARTEGRTLGLLGEPRINVADLNRALLARPRAPGRPTPPGATIDR
jgi:K+-transporting ATPase ATPase C chain